jgi:hypothetical protein
VRAVIYKTLDPPAEYNPNLPDSADEVLLTALATEKNDCYETVLHFRDALSTLVLDSET